MLLCLVISSRIKAFTFTCPCPITTSAPPLQPRWLEASEWQGGSLPPLWPQDLNNTATGKLVQLVKDYLWWWLLDFCHLFWNLQETSKLRAGGHGFSNGNLAALSQSCGSRPPHHGSRGKVDRKIASSPADHTRVPYSHQNHNYHYQRHTGHPRALQHNPPLHPLEEKDSRSHHHKQSTVRN